MTIETILKAQDYLTIINNSHVRKIIDIKTLVQRHSTTSVINLLDTLYKEKKKILKNLLIEDKTTLKVDETVVTMFRLYMAIKTIERESEVKVA